MPLPAWWARVRAWLNTHGWTLAIGLVVGGTVVVAAAFDSPFWMVAAAVVIVAVVVWAGGRRRAALSDAIAVLTVAGMLFGIYLGARTFFGGAEAPTPPGGSVPAAEPGVCIPPGAGQPDYEKAFTAAFRAAGGQAALGCGKGLAGRWGDGVSQSFQSPRGIATIAAVSPDRAYVLDADAVKCINEAVNGGETFPTAGYPRGAPSRIPGGLRIDLGAGATADKGAQVVLRRGSGRCYWVSDPIWPRYEQLGGPSGPYGFPTSPVHSFQDGLRQDFEHGWLYRKPGGAVLTADEERAAPSSAATPASPTAGTTGTAGAQPPSDRHVSYDVNGDRARGALSIVVRAGGYVTQQFVAASSTVTWAGVIAGCDPGLTATCGPDGTSFGPLNVQILDDTRVVASAQVDTTNNGTSGGALGPVTVTPGRRYVLRVVNASGIPVGFYFNRNADPALDTVISGAWHRGDDGPDALDLAALVDDRSG
ncbi:MULTISPECIES: hypothetical protein [Frankia]|uniref:Uncharacterized protein n=1 Tax=Frankia alni (strain DSM 45986 / CECT 9034 / ACN14a) TaxID=326424 RepID=Q0RRX4_FRAAA|nr:MULTISPECIES: hypothetical protein [Frankia]CAJ59691.1 hypothetical protein; putative membrane protein [Frankia alni ACN14a]